MISIEEFFPHLTEYNHRSLFDNIEWVWEPLKCLESSTASILSSRNKDKAQALPKGLTVSPGGVLVERWVEAASPLLIAAAGVYIGEGTTLEPTAIIKGPAVIGSGCEIRQGAYIRGNVLVGDHCTIGHCTEIKNSIIMNHTEAGHFNYIGDSILGSYVNMGAGSRLANVQFRSLREKKDGFIQPIEIPVEGKTVPTGIGKLGAVLGDNVELGCNAVLCPGTLLARDNWVYPNTTLPKGYYPPNQFHAPQDRKPRAQNK